MDSNSVVLHEDAVEHILKFADGTTLANAEAVCFTWKSIVARLSKKYEIWRLCCEEEIPKEELFDLLTKLYPRFSLPEGKKTIEWRTVYEHWKQWLTMPSWVYMVQKAPIDFGFYNMNYCFSVKSSGDWLLIGTKSCLLLYNMKNSFMIPVRTAGYVVKINLFVSDKPEVRKDTTYLPDLIPKNMVHKLEHDYAVMLLRNHPPLCVNFDLHSGKLEQTDDEELPIGFNERNMRMHSDQRYEFSENKNYLIPYYLNARASEATMITWRRSRGSLCSMQLESGNDILSYFWHGKLVISFVHDYIIMQVNGKLKQYHPLRDASIRPTAALFYLNMLFIGSDLGTVLMFRVSKPEDMLYLDLQKPTWSIKLCKSPIKGFEIMETSPRPTIVCHSVDEIYFIKFLSM